ncbi:MAG TPA: choice-of-anchor Q domain-containing protein [Chthoniobacterales bacterium]|nr:choice-of-anchor Q domain-containing protein [Chthoniobacterales bacterium]
MMRFVFAAMALWAVGGNFARGACPPQYTQNFDFVTPPALPAGWTASQGMNLTGAPLWVTSAITPDTPPNDAFSTAPDNILDNRLDTPSIFVSSNDFSGSFRHSYNLEAGFDGAVLEISNPSINGGAFTDVTDPAVGGHFDPGTGYNTTISAASQSPLAGRMAWGGNSNGYVRCGLIFGMPFQPGFFGSTIFRFRLVTDNSGASGGWRIDTFRWEHSECNPPSPTPSSPTPTPTTTATPSPTPTPTAPPAPTPTPAQALNIATRLRVETGDRIAIGGFIIAGPGPKKVAIRGIGPSLSNFGLSDVLADPTLELRGSDGALLVQNDNWQDNASQAAQLVALHLAPQHPNESGIVTMLQPGAYTALLRGKNQTSGIALVEIYDADAVAPSRLANIATRGFVSGGDNVMIAGFILGSGYSTSVGVRGIGPSLAQFGLSNVLPDPTLELRDSNGAVLAANDNWQDDRYAAAQLSANGLAPQDQSESGIFTTLPPGLFTAILAGKKGGTGLGLVEVYNNLNPSTIIVTNTSPSGPGSLVQALADANDGDTIRFDPSLNGQPFTNVAEKIDKNIVISGPGPNQLTLGGGLGLSVLEIDSGHTVIIEGLTIRDGDAPIAGGGILNNLSTVTINDCIIISNSSDGSGGGVSNVGTMTIMNSTVSDNHTTGDFNSHGGGISNGGTITITNSIISGNSVGSSPFMPGIGGGIFNSGVATMMITDSTVSSNRAVGGGGIGSDGAMTISNSSVTGNMALAAFGFGGLGAGILTKNSPIMITNSTISGNSASDAGGGIYSSNSATVTVTHSTVSDNQANGNGDSILNSASLRSGDTILKVAPSGINIVNNSPGTITSYGYNLSSDSGSGFLNAAGDQLNANPMLGPLQNNGGPTLTQKLLPGSPAIDRGDPNFVPPPFWDQRGIGYDRVVNGRIDIGAFEVQPTPTPSPTPN